MEFVRDDDCKDTEKTILHKAACMKNTSMWV